MSKQDRQGVRTATDLERKYDLASLVGVKKAVENNVEGLNKTNATLENFMSATLETMEELQSLIDGNITTWFYSGVPTLSNPPASDWTTDLLKNEHLGDLYYDQDTGYAYRFALCDGVYKWLELADNDVAEALAIANKALDTADNKRRVFVAMPTVPYDVGDLWIYDDELYVCSIASTDTYDASHWRKATKYTDDSALNTFISGDYADDLKTINEQIDKKSETWHQSTDPSVIWTTEELKKAHVGDLWFNTTEKKSYMYSSSYKWEEADGVPDSVYDEIDGKAQIFASLPIPPYYVNDLYVQGTSGDILVCQTERLTGIYTASDWVKASKYTDDSALNNFVYGEYADDLQAITTQIDKKAETWYQASDPSTGWTVEALKKAHVGDLWYNTTENKNYVYTSSYKWQEIDGVPDSVYDKIDGKAQVFASQPTPPYHVGDLYTQGTNGDILVCKTERLTGSYTASDWVKASKYTDDTELHNFVDITFTESMKSLNDLIDTKITTWYYSGVPTLSNLPASEWTTNDLKASHVGDLYYDKATGHTYRFSGSYAWERIIDSDLTEALALANASKDTADSKRRIFTAQPSPPYDNGDLWFYNKEIYICQVSKAEGETYADKDFIIATKYTDDTLATQVGDNLEIVRGTVTTIKEGVDAFKIDIETTVKSIDELQQETIESMERMSYTFGTKDLVIANSNDPVNARINNQGLKVYTYNDLQAIFNHKGSGVQKLIVVGDAQLGNISVVKSTDGKGNPCTDINYLVSNVQTLSDLEGE